MLSKRKENYVFLLILHKVKYSITCINCILIQKLSIDVYFNLFVAAPDDDLDGEVAGQEVAARGQESPSSSRYGSPVSCDGSSASWATAESHIDSPVVNVDSSIVEADTAESQIDSPIVNLDSSTGEVDTADDDIDTLDASDTQVDSFNLQVYSPNSDIDSADMDLESPDMQSNEPVLQMDSFSSLSYAEPPSQSNTDLPVESDSVEDIQQTSVVVPDDSCE